MLADYFNLGVNLTAKAAGWAAKDGRYREIAAHIYGARMLRQDPVECLFEFICSSNNHISRIGGMVAHLCRTYGTPLPPPTVDAGESAVEHHAFPSIMQLQAATEESLRSAGFGYRARYIVETAAALHAHPTGELLTESVSAHARSPPYNSLARREVAPAPACTPHPERALRH